jgi:hypothetical protein
MTAKEDEFIKWMCNRWFVSPADKIKLLQHIDNIRDEHQQLFNNHQPGEDKSRQVIFSFIEWIANKEEWIWSNEDANWKKEGWRSRTTAELYAIYGFSTK